MVEVGGRKDVYVGAEYTNEFPCERFADELG